MNASTTLEKGFIHPSVEQPVPEEKNTSVLAASNAFGCNVPRTDNIITYIDETWYPVYFLDNGEVLYSHE